ncbi:MAG: VOC family protein [Ilumatobacteraceae bacterium]
MHRSRIGVVLIDHPFDTYDAATAFWLGVRGGSIGTSEDQADDSPYVSLDPLPGGMLLELQRTGSGTGARVHLDIETDDVVAEIARVVALGASIVHEHDGYAVMRDPGGLLFCVVPVQTGDEFDRYATTWP